MKKGVQKLISLLLLIILISNYIFSLLTVYASVENTNITNRNTNSGLLSGISNLFSTESNKDSVNDNTNFNEVKLLVGLKRESEELELSKVIDINNQDTSIYINFKNIDGKFENANFNFLSESIMNFTIANKKELVSKYEIIDEITNTEIKFNVNKLNDLSTLKEIELPIKYSYEGEKEENNLNDNFEFNFRGELVKENQEKVEIKKDNKFNINWENNNNTIIESELSKFIILPNNEKQNLNIILQNKVILKNEELENNFPIKNLNIRINTPEIQNAIKINSNVALIDTKGINLNENIILKEEDVKVINENNTIEFNLENKLSENNLYTQGKGKVEFLVTTKYETNNLNIVNQLPINSNLEVIVNKMLYGNENIITNNYIKEVVLNNINNEVITANTILNNNEISKLDFYLNYVNQSTKFIQIETNTNLNIASKDGIENITLIESTPIYNNDSNLVEKNAIYKKIEISKSEFDNILGENGEIEVLSDGQKIDKINKFNLVENNNYILPIKSIINNVSLKTSEIKNEGSLNVKKTREISNISYHKVQFKNFNKLNLIENVNYKNKEVEYNLGNIVSEIKLNDTKTDVNIHSNQLELTNLDENKNVELVVQLNNDKENSDIYSDGIYEILLPEEFKEVTLNNINMLYAQGLNIENAEILNENSRKIIRILTSGIQTEKNTGILTNGTNIVINLDIKLDENTTANELKYYLLYANKEATVYNQETNYKLTNSSYEYANLKGISINNIGYSENSFKVLTKVGVVVSNKLINYDNTNKEISTIKQGEKVVNILNNNNDEYIITNETNILNNLGANINNIHILGQIPNTGNINFKENTILDTNLNMELLNYLNLEIPEGLNYKIYYSDNPSSNANLNDLSNNWQEVLEINKIKNYLIKIEDTLINGENIKISTNIKVDKNIGFNKIANFNTNIYYGIENDNENMYLENSDYIRIETPRGTTLSANLKGEFNQIEKQSKVIYTLDIANNDNTITSNDVKIKLFAPKGVELTNIYSNTYELPFDIDENKNSVVSLGDINPNTKVEVKLVYSIGNDVVENVKLGAQIKANNQENIVTVESEEKIVKNDSFKLEVLKSEEPETTNVIEDTLKTFIINTTNLLDYTQSATNFEIELSDNIVIEQIILKNEQIKFEKDQISNTYRAKNLEILKGQVDQIKLKVRFKNISDKTKKFEDYKVTFRAIDQENQKTNEFNYLGYIIKPVLKIDSKVNKKETYLEENTELEYSYNIKNEGTAKSKIKLDMLLPNGNTKTAITVSKNNQTILENEIYSNNSNSQELELDVQEEITVKYSVKLPSLLNQEYKSILGQLKVTETNINKEVLTPEITQIIKKNQFNKQTEKMIENSQIIVSEEQYKKLNKKDGDLNINKANSNENTNLISRKYEIKGTAWNDKNQNGILEDNEDVFPNMIVKLVDNKTQSVIRTTKTMDNGIYEFNNLLNGDYIVVYEYDSNKFKPTVFNSNEKIGNNSISENSSNAIKTIVTNKDEEKEIAVTDAIKINFNSQNNQNIGLINQDTFNLELKSKIIEVNELTQNNEIKNKLKLQESKANNEIKYLIKNSHNSNKVRIKLELELRNLGNIKGTAQRVKVLNNKNIKYDFNKVLNENWEQDELGNIYTTAFSSYELQNKESQKILLILDLDKNEFKNKEFSLEFEIEKSQNEAGVVDVDSVENNGNTNENDYTKVEIEFKNENKLIILISIIIISSIIIAKMFEIQKKRDISIQK